MHRSIVSLGDFNMDLLKSLEFSDELQQSYDFKQFVYSATRITSSSSTLNDHLYATSSVDVCFSGTSNLHITEYLAIFCCINYLYSSMHVQQCHRILCNRSCKGLNRELLFSDLSSADWCSIFKHNDIDYQVSAFTSAFLIV